MKDPLKTIESLKNLRLSDHEKAEMFLHIQNHIDESLKKPIPSPFNVFSFIQHHAIYATSFALLLLISATSAAAETALPGDLLYSVKKNVNEGVMQALAFDTQDKAAVQIRLVDRRLEEAEKVIAQNSASKDETLLALASEVQDHAQAALTHIENVHTEDSVVTAVELTNDLSTTLSAHDSVIDEVTAQEDGAGIAANEATDTQPVAPMAATMSMAKMMAASEAPEEPTLSSIIEETKQQVQATSDNLSSLVVTSDEPLVSEDKLNESKAQVQNILEDENVSTSTKETVEYLVHSAEENANQNDLNGAFIILEEAQKIGESESRSEEIKDEI